MELSKTCTIPASIETTWQALNDPQFLRDCIVGCESIERVADNDYKVVLAAKVGPVNARFNGRMRLEDLNPPRSYSITFDGQGGAAGFAKGRARVNLEAEAGDAATLMSYQVQAQVGGKLAQIGSRLIDAAARKLADDFFDSFTSKIASQRAPEPAVVEAAAAAAGRPESPHTANKRWLVVALVVVAIVVVWFVMRRIG